MTFKVGFLFQICLLIYVGGWAYFKFRQYMLLRKNARPSVYEIERLETISGAVRLFGWFLVIWLALSLHWLFPEVLVVTQDAGRAGAERYYVPFCYKGKFCVPGNKYLSNETDSTLVLYPTCFYNGSFTKNISEKELITINSHSFVQWDEYIDNKFHRPVEHDWGYIPEKHKNKFVIEWTLDTKSGAIMGRDMVQIELEERNKLMKEVWNN